MKYKYEVEINDEFLYENKDTDCIDSWGDATIWMQNGKVGAEYNFCIDETNCSAIYKMYQDAEGDIRTDYSEFIHYEIDFNDPEWVNKLEQALYDACINLNRMECG